MERERWLLLYTQACALSRSWKDGQRYSAACIVGVFLWAVVHDRPVSWACQQAHWPQELHFGRLPSQATMSRRLRSGPVIKLLHLLEQALAAAPSPASQAEPRLQVIDAKPLPVGGYSKDPDARWGRACGGGARGYKFFAIWGSAPLPTAWEVASMNVNEKTVAEHLIPQLTGTGCLLGDAQYDSNRLYDLAFAHGHQMLAPRRKRGGLGHHYQSPHRLAAIAQLEGQQWPQFHRQRIQIERHFGHWTSFGGGLAPLPSWVRRHGRVRLWVQAKLLINAVRIQQRQLANA